jgi:hypothetical protein
LKHTTVEGVKELLEIKGSRLDSKLSMIFYLFRWHPSNKKKLIKLNRENNINEKLYINIVDMR